MRKALKEGQDQRCPVKEEKVLTEKEAPSAN